MSTYELDDEQVRRVVSGRATAVDQDALFRVLEEQLPTPEPPREYIVIDAQRDVWIWSVRQSAWECSRYPAAVRGWQSLVKQYGPLKVYSKVTG